MPYIREPILIPPFQSKTGRSEASRYLHAIGTRPAWCRACIFTPNSVSSEPGAGQLVHSVTHVRGKRQWSCRWQASEVLYRVQLP